MRKLLIFALMMIININFIYASSMRRCTLLPITDSVGGAIGYKVFEQVEEKLKQGNWCTYVSNSSMINIFSKYKDNLPQYLKNKEVLTAVAQKLKVGSILRVGIVNELKSVEVNIDIYGEDGEDIYFSERLNLDKDDVDLISSTISNWLEMYSKMIPYDAKVNGILGEQLNLDVGKGYPIYEGQRFLVKRLVGKKKHPLLKKVVDWETDVLAEGIITSISDNQALGMIKSYKHEKKVMAGDWVRLEEIKEDITVGKVEDDVKNEKIGTLGILSVSMFASNMTIDSSTPSGSNTQSGRLYGVDARAEGWITRQYFAALEMVKAIGNTKKRSGTPQKDTLGVNTSSYKLTGGFKYLPIGFFYGPQIDLFGGFAYHSYDLDYSQQDGYGKANFTGIVVGTNVNVPLSRDFRVCAGAEFMPFPTFKDEDSNFGSAKNASSMELKVGIKYQYNMRMSLDFGIENHRRKAKFNGPYKQISYDETRFLAGASFNY